MFIGHGLLAFALIALVGERLEWSPDRTLLLAVVAFGFGTLPDVDIVYAPVGLLGGVSGVFAASEAFWQTGNIVHRAMTHSLVVGIVAAVAFGCWTGARDWTRSGRPSRRQQRNGLLAVGLLGSLVVAATVATGGLAGIIMTVFVLAGLALTTVAARRGISPRLMGGLALVGLLTHPFGDLVTGSPPALLYPFDIPVVTERVVLHPDPTLHLVGAFLLELATIWLAAVAYGRLRGIRLRDHVSPRAAAGVGYAGAALVLPAPTLEASAPFVFSVLAVGVVGSVGLRRRLLTRKRAMLSGGWRTRPVSLADLPTAILTGLSAVTLAVLGYTLTFLLI